MTLYEIDRSMEDLVDPETGELLDYEKFAQLQMAREAKLENMAMWVKNLKAEADAIKAEKKNLEARQQAAENKAKRLQEYLTEALGGEKFKTARVVVSYRKSASVEVTDEAAVIEWMEHNGYDRYVKYAAPSVSKTDVKKVLDCGVKIPGAELVERQNVQIK